MSEAEFSFLPLQVVRVGGGGKRRFEPEGKRRWNEAWRIRRSEQRKAVLRTLPAFVPVVAVDGAPPSMPHDALSRVPISVPDARLTARLPNGVTVELACGGQHAPLLRTMLEALGAPGCSASTRR